jgi:hypothetical protein
MIKLYFIDYLIIGLYLYYFISIYIKSIRKKMSICDKHYVWECFECDEYVEYVEYEVESKVE